MTDIQSFPITDRMNWLAWRRQDITASVAAALFGSKIHPYATPYSLWMEKSGLVTGDVVETPAMRFGRRIEGLVIETLREDERPDWTIEPAKHYFRDPVHRIGATPDAFAWRPDIEGRGVLQIKSVNPFAFKKNWKDDLGEVDVPDWICVQTSVEAALTGATWAAVAVISGVKAEVIDIPIVPSLMVKVRNLSTEFWQRVAEGRAYPADYGRDADMIKMRYSEDDGSLVHLQESPFITEILIKRRMLKDIETRGNEAEKLRKEIDVGLLDILGNAQAAMLPDGTTIKAPVTYRKAYPVAASQFRAVRVKETAARLAIGQVGNVDDAVERMVAKVPYAGKEKRAKRGDAAPQSEESF